jgi:hypothetical protein
MSASPPAPLIWGALLCRLVPEGMVWDARVHQWVPQPEPYNALAVPRRSPLVSERVCRRPLAPLPPRNAVEAAAAASSSATGELVSQALNPVSAGPACALGPYALGVP